MGQWATASPKFRQLGQAPEGTSMLEGYCAPMSRGGNCINRTRTRHEGRRLPGFNVSTPRSTHDRLLYLSANWSSRGDRSSANSSICHPQAKVGRSLVWRVAGGRGGGGVRGVEPQASPNTPNILRCASTTSSYRMLMRINPYQYVKIGFSRIFTKTTLLSKSK